MLDPAPSPPQEVKYISLAVLKTVLNGIRVRLLGRLIEAPQTVPALASELGLPVTRLYYHIHRLEAHGLAEVVAQHPAGGTIEHVYRATARQFLVDRAEFAPPGPAAVAQAKVLTSVGLVETAKEIQRSTAAGLIDLRTTPPAPQALFLRRAVGQLSAEQAAEFHRRLTALFAEFTTPSPADSSPTAGDATYTVAVAFFPSQPAQDA